LIQGFGWPLGELRIGREPTESAALAEELKDFQRCVTVTGRFQYEARVGKHDDWFSPSLSACGVCCAY
jgi:hypothetical protein